MNARDIIDRLREQDDENAQNLADKLEEVMLGIGFYSWLFDVGPEEIVNAIRSDESVRRGFNEMAGGFEEHSFDLALIDYFPHLERRERPDGDIGFGVNERSILGKLKRRYYRWKA